MERYTVSMPLLPSALPPKGEASRYGANIFLNLIALRSRGIFLALRSVSHRHWQGTDALLLCIPTFTHESFISLQERFLDFARNDDTCFLHPKMQCSMNGVPLQTLLTKSPKLINRNTSH